MKDKKNPLYFQISKEYKEKYDFICSQSYLTKTGFLKQKIDEEFNQLKQARGLKLNESVK